MENYHNENSSHLNHRKEKAQPSDQLLHKNARCPKRQEVLGLYIMCFVNYMVIQHQEKKRDGKYLPCASSTNRLKSSGVPYRLLAAKKLVT